MGENKDYVFDVFIKKAETSEEKRKAILECEDAFSVIGGIDPGKIIDKICVNAEVLIAYNPGIIGYCAIYANDPGTREGYITLIGVKEEFQGKQIGSKLLDASIDVAQKKGMNSIKLEVYRENVKAKEFYLKHGFEIVGEETERGFYMRKTIA